MMEKDNWLINELIGKTILVKTHGGVGTLDVSLKAGEYKGILLGFDGRFLRLEYNIRKFVNGVGSSNKDIILINTQYVISIDEFVGED